MKRASADFHVIGLQNHATLLCPVGMQLQDKRLEGRVGSVGLRHGGILGLGGDIALQNTGGGAGSTIGFRKLNGFAGRPKFASPPSRNRKGNESV